jgi:hypothetical protein
MGKSMKIRAFILIIFALIFIPSTGYAGLFGYSNYSECILKEMPGVQNDQAASAVMRNCREKAPNNDVKQRSSGVFSRMTADKCIIKYSKGTASERASQQIRNACRRIYPK